MRTYHELDLDERVDMQPRLDADARLRAIARSLERSAHAINASARARKALRTIARRRHERAHVESTARRAT